MSIPVGLDELRSAVERHGRSAYLITVSAEARPHVVSIALSWDGERLVGASGRHTTANVQAYPTVTLLWPPFEPGGYSLVCDGSAEIVGDQVAVAPTKAVLHRPAVTPEGDGCGHDCVPVLKTTA